MAKTEILLDALNRRSVVTDTDRLAEIRARIVAFQNDEGSAQEQLERGTRILFDDAPALLGLVDELQAALEWYGDWENQSWKDYGTPLQWHPMIRDGGQRARAALNGDDDDIPEA